MKVRGRAEQNLKEELLWGQRVSEHNPRDKDIYL